MATIDEILKKMADSPQNIRFPELCRVCDSYFGKARQQGSSHRVYKTPWQGGSTREHPEQQRKSKGLSGQTGFKSNKEAEP
jgi:hypothetical protein